MDFNSIKEKLYSMGLKRICQNLLIAALITAIIVIFTDSFFYKGGGRRNSIDGTDIQLNRQSISSVTYEEQLENKLECILRQIYGVGKVSVMITIKAGKETVPIFNTVKSDSETNEKDSGGGVRIVTQSNIDRRLAQGSGGGITSDKPLISKEMMPEVLGVIVVAEGAQKPEITEQLTEAVQAVLGIPAFRVKVYPM